MRNVTRLGLIAVGSLGVILLAYAAMFSDRWDSHLASFGLSPDGETIVFAGAGKGGSDLYLLDLKTLRVRALTHSPEAENCPQFSPDGKQIVYAAAADTTSQSIFVCSLDGTGRRQLTHDTGVFDATPSFSPNGAQIVFTRATLHRPYSYGGMIWEQYDIYIMDKDGSHLHRLTSKQYNRVYTTKLAPQRQTVIYDADHSVSKTYELGTDIFQVSASRPGEPLALTSNGRSSHPVFSLSGSQIYFLSYLDTSGNFDYEVWVMDSNGKHARQITQAHSFLENIVVARDGQHAYVLSDIKRNRNFELEEVTLSDGHLRQIADSSLFGDPLHWTPSASE